MRRPEIAQKVSDAKKGKSLQELGHKEDCTCPVCRMMRGNVPSEEHPAYGHRCSKETKRKIGEANSRSMKKLWSTNRYVQMQMKARGVAPNKAELLLLSILNQYFPNQWRYVGDGQLIISAKCPDFVHIDRKLLIELFGDYWHDESEIGPRTKIFEVHGYRTLILWEHELQVPSIIVNKVVEFTAEN